MEQLRLRLAEMKKEREWELAHPRDCKCGGHGNIPMAQFSSGYVKCCTGPNDAVIFIKYEG
jgi:hypothetical protein